MNEIIIKSTEAERTQDARAARKDHCKYEPEYRILNILDILKTYTDDTHTLDQKGIIQILDDRNEKYSDYPSSINRNTFRKTLEKLLGYVNPSIYDDNDDDFMIKYAGYNNTNESEDGDARKRLFKLHYEHIFKDSELDQLMHAINFDSSLSEEDKARLMSKLQGTASKYYESPLFNKYKDEVKFYNSDIHHRLDVKNKKASVIDLPKNIRTIQEAINKQVKVRFMLNGYDENHDITELPIGSYDELFTVSPYYIVVYQELYYLISAFDNATRPNIYRIDLMTKVNLAVDDDGKNVKAMPAKAVPGLDTKDVWDPEKFMREHLYMFYDEPREVTLRIKNDEYTLLHDWFGDTYKKGNIGSGLKNYDLVTLRCTTDAMVIFCMQFSDKVEVMDEDIRELVRKRIQLMAGKYDL